MALCLAESYLHRIDPFAVHFPAGWPLEGIKWYGLAYLAGFAVAWVLLRWLSRTGRSALAPAAIPDLMVFIVVGVLLGGRLGYCAFYEPALLVQFTSRFPFWGFLAIHKGGMASHGGMIGVIVACWLFARSRGVSALHLLDLATLMSLPGLFFGRLANFVNAELPGVALPAARQASPPWWSVKYPDELLQPGFDVARLEPVRNDLVKALDLPAGVYDQDLLDAAWRALHDGDQRVIELVQPLLTAFHPSQLYQANTDGPILAILLVAVWWKPRKPGVVGSWFLVGYGVLRLVTEVFRQPDPGVRTWHTPLGDLSRGQLLSALMVIVGAACVVVACRRDVPKVGGLGPRSKAEGMAYRGAAESAEQATKIKDRDREGPTARA